MGWRLFGDDLRLRVCNARFLRFLDLPDAMGIPGTAAADLLRLAGAAEQAEELFAQPGFCLKRRNEAGQLLDISGSRGDGGMVLTCTVSGGRDAAGRPDWKQANLDALTGLPGRLLFMELLKHQVQRGSRSGYNDAALLLLDIDGFKALNQTHGNAVCDLLLTEIALRLSGAVRESDVVGRMEGDQFAILAVDVHTAENVEIVAGKLLAAIARTFTVHDAEIRLTASIGIAFQPANCWTRQP